MTRPQPRARMPGADGARAEERGLQVGLDHRVPVGLAQLFDGAADVHAGVVHQDVDRTQAALDLAHQALDVGGR